MGKIEIKSPDYFSTKYCTPQRMVSYNYQIKEALACNPKNLLEVGIGNGVVSYVLKGAGIEVTTLDVDDKLKPEIVGSVQDIPFGNNTFDALLCCEVLEHLPFEEFSQSVSEIHRVTCRFAILSLPDATRYYRIVVRLPKLRFRLSREFAQAIAFPAIGGLFIVLSVLALKTADFFIGLRGFFLLAGAGCLSYLGVTYLLSRFMNYEIWQIIKDSASDGRAA